MVDRKRSTRSYRSKQKKKSNKGKKQQGGCAKPLMFVLAVAAVVAFLLFGPPHCIDRLQTEDTQDASQESSQEALQETQETQETIAPEVVEEEPTPTTYYYAYSTLDEQRQQVYDAILYATEHRSSEEVDIDGEDAIDMLEIVMADHPELFYAKGIHVRTETVGDSKSTSVEANYTFNEEEQAQAQSAIDASVERCLAGVSSSWDDYETAKYLYDYIASNTDYELDVPNNQNIVSVFVNGRSVCNGYAKAFQYLAQKLGIPCVLVTGTARGGLHAWVAAELDGAWYFIDPTWGDPQFLSDESGSWSGYINYEYLGVTTADIERTHTARDNGFPIPTCTSTDDNYYAREGLLYSEVDESKLRETLRSAKDSGGGYARFKAASAEVFNEMHELLLDQNLALDVLGGDKIRYAESDETRTIVIVCQ